MTLSCSLRSHNLTYLIELIYFAFNPFKLKTGSKRPSGIATIQTHTFTPREKRPVVLLLWPWFKVSSEGQGFISTTLY